MRDLLFLAHRIPFPPDKGDKIRSFHELRYLATRFRVHLGAFVDSQDDWRHVESLRAYCADSCFLPLRPWQAKLRSLGGLLSGEPLTVPYYRDPRMAAWLRSVVNHNSPDAALVFSSAMAQYAQDLDIPVCVLDFVDVDSQKWTQYAESHPWPFSWLYRREGEQLLAYERKLAQRFDVSLFVSKAEARLFTRLVPEAAERVKVLENGVDAAYFQANATYPSPYPSERPILVFTGAMDYWPNVDGVVWFVREVFPKVLRTWPEALFYIVGSRPHKSVLALRERPGVCVTGRVDDVRPYLAHANLACVPLRLARGIQNKVLEAMAMGRALLASPQAMEGIESVEGTAVTVAQTVSDWVSAIDAVLSQRGEPRFFSVNRDFAMKNYDWETHLAKLEFYLRGEPC
ncbi:TIGR03087 family PEP-CTERM/XrtA system glycosyltransferase [Methyloterricola oryzae]|uniref:TIGR03087 family PEP-CTERM/XrtA system glycosyltransferase n=1 Tax=Methyloterricola oryzae TaxID=1495050 RepID=UPI0005EB9069|nr:TIGR03087 family PEP-CTERM/XrtA system glycosyltransferase [Methyloterricola oryzae]